MNNLNPVMTYTGIPNPTQYLEHQSLSQEKEIWTIQQRIMAKEKEILAKEEVLAAEKETLHKAKLRLAHKVEDLAKKNPKRNQTDREEWSEYQNGLKRNFEMLTGNQTDREKWIEYINGLRTSEILKNQAIISIINSSIPDKCYRLSILFDWGLRVHKELIGKLEDLYGLSEDLKTTLVLNSTPEPHKVVVTSSMIAAGIREVEHTCCLEFSKAEKVEEPATKKRKKNQTDRENWKVVETRSMIASSDKESEQTSFLEAPTKLDRMDDYNYNDFMITETDKDLESMGLMTFSDTIDAHASSLSEPTKMDKIEGENDFNSDFLM
jgi:hypothetical protein